MMQQPMMQQPMMQQPVGIMASSPELMQASMGYNQGGPVQGYAGGKTVTPGNRAGVIIGETTNSNPSLIPPPTVDITQEPIEFQETVTETVGPETVGGFTEEGLAQEIKKYSDPFLNPDVQSEPKPEASDADTLSKAEQLGAQAIDNGELNPDTAPAPLADAVNTLNDPDKTPTEEADAILAGMRNAAAMAGKASDYTPERLRQRAIEAILRSPDQFNVYNDETGAVDPAKVQREADILVSAMSNNTVDITKPTATGAGGTNDMPTTPGVRFRDKTTGKIMVVGEDGVAVEE